jgi:hypothetical protein
MVVRSNCGFFHQRLVEVRRRAPCRSSAAARYAANSTIPDVMLYDIRTRAALGTDEYIAPRSRPSPFRVRVSDTRRARPRRHSDLSILSRESEEVRGGPRRRIRAHVMRKSCFSPGLSASAKHSCVASAYATLIFFGITMWGREARCVRYFDPSPNYPNLHLRGLVRDVLAFDVPKGVALLEDFLRTRTKLADRNWIEGVADWRRAGALWPDLVHLDRILNQPITRLGTNGQALAHAHLPAGADRQSLNRADRLVRQPATCHGKRCGHGGLPVVEPLCFR